MIPFDFSQRCIRDPLGFTYILVFHSHIRHLSINFQSQYVTSSPDYLATGLQNNAPKSPLPFSFFPVSPWQRLFALPISGFIPAWILSYWAHDCSLPPLSLHTCHSLWLECPLSCSLLLCLFILCLFKIYDLKAACPE